MRATHDEHLTWPHRGRWPLCLVLALTLLAAACGGGGGSSTATATTGAGNASAPTEQTSTTSGTTATATATATGTSAGTSTATAAASGSGAAGSTSTSTTASTATASSTSTASSSPSADLGSPESGYLDDRSTATAVIESYYDAINKKEYARAYSYWEPNTPSSQLAPFDQFQQGYGKTASVQLTTGTVGGDVGAGQLYYSVPVVLRTKLTDGSAQTFAGCYILHLGRPEIQTAPPFHPMGIQSAKVQQQDNAAGTSNLLSQACQGQPGNQTSPLPATVTPSPTDISAARYLDDRSSATEVIRSFYNAINSKEYARAYSYWQPNTPAAQLPAFPQFQQGYAKTASVTLTTGTVTANAGAGQRYYMVPVALVSTQTDGSKQTFVGCYTLHISVPQIQAAPPFQPLAIQSASVKQVANGSDTSSLLSQACHG